MGQHSQTSSLKFLSSFPISPMKLEMNEKVSVGKRTEEAYYKYLILDTAHKNFGVSSPTTPIHFFLNVYIC